MSSLTLIGAHRAVSSLLETRPDSWGVVRFKGLFDRLDQRNTDLSYEMLSLRSTGEVVARAEMGGRQEPDETSLPKYLVAEVDDLVVNPMWLIGGGIGVSGRAGAVSPDYRVFRSRDSLLPRFIHYLLRSRPYLDQYLLYTRAQTTFDRRVQQSDLDNLPIPVPPLDEQCVIVGYLDRETARIDILIEEQHRLIEMLRERRSAAIAARLDSLAGMTRLKHVSTVQTGVTLSGEGDITDPEWPYLRVANVQVGYVDLREIKTVRVPPDKATASMLQPGDVLMTEGGDIDKLGRGALWRGELPDMLHQNHIFAVRPDKTLDSEFLVYWLDGPIARTYFRTTAKQTTNLAGTNKWTLGNLPVPVPPLNKQRQLVATLDEQTAQIDTLLKETERFIELSKERRAALITAAVTGQVDVRGMA
jgi:type I restriction enzyme S subunit